MTENDKTKEWKDLKKEAEEQQIQWQKSVIREEYLTNEGS